MQIGCDNVCSSPTPKNCRDSILHQLLLFKVTGAFCKKHVSLNGVYKNRCDYLPLGAGASL